MSCRRLWLAVLLIGILLLAPGARGLAQAPLQVGVVIQEDERVQTYCVVLDTPNPTGYDALRATGAPVLSAVSPQGVGVCQIGDTGCPPNNCFCQCQGTRCSYWAYAHVSGGAWLTSNVGAAGRSVSHGDVEGWRWGAGEPPPLYAFEQICTGEEPGAPSVSPEPGAPVADGTRGGGQVSLLVPIGITLGAAAVAIAISRKRAS